MAVIVIAVAGAAAHLGGVALQERNDGVVGHPAALHAKIVDDVAEPKIRHNPS